MRWDSPDEGGMLAEIVGYKLITSKNTTWRWGYVPSVSQNRATLNLNFVVQLKTWQKAGPFRISILELLEPVSEVNFDSLDKWKRQSMKLRKVSLFGVFFTDLSGDQGSFHVFNWYYMNAFEILSDSDLSCRRCTIGLGCKHLLKSTASCDQLYPLHKLGRGQLHTVAYVWETIPIIGPFST